MNYADDAEEYYNVGVERDESENYTQAEQLKFTKSAKHMFSGLVILLVVGVLGYIGMFVMLGMNGFPIDPVSVVTNTINSSTYLFNNIDVSYKYFVDTLNIGIFSTIWLCALFLVIIVGMVMYSKAVNYYVKINKQYRYGRLHSDVVNTSATLFIMLIAFVYILLVILSVPI